MTMQLKKLEIERCTWRHKPDFGQMSGTMTCDGDGGEVTLRLNSEQCARMLAICADGIIGAAKEAATCLMLEAQATLAQEVKQIK